jgi:hypothetical protein
MKDLKNCFKNTLTALFVGAMLFASCKKDEPKSAACDIVSFSVNGVAWNISGTGITHTYPSETAESALTPAITLSPGATVNPPASQAQNFFTGQGVTYTVTAEDGVTTKNYTVEATIQAIASGATGDCTWALTGTAGNYTLTISGAGDMDNYSYDTRPPWCEEYGNNITTLVIREGVTSIGSYAFHDCSGLTGALTIPSSVTSIGFNTFTFCSGLTSVTIPSSVTSIGMAAFMGCSGLTSVTIPSSVTSISVDAFAYCSGLTSVNVDVTNASYASENGVLFSKDKTTLIFYPLGKTGNSYTIPSSVTSIGEQAFSDCIGLTSVTIPSSVTSIGDLAFADCSSLTSALIPSSVTSIGHSAFFNCSGLTEVINLNPVPQNINSDVFNGVNTNSCTLKVPSSSVNVYKTATGWSEFNNIAGI